MDDILRLFTGRCGHSWVGALSGYYGCPVCDDYDGDHHLISSTPIAVQVDDWGTTWRVLAELQETMNAPD